MPKKFTDEEYYKNLPTKQVGTAVLLFNEAGDLLIVKPDYRDAWLVPGGSADENESPLSCAVREVREEIGLTIADLRLVGVFSSPREGLRPDSLKFIFAGQTLTEKQIAEIRIEEGEIEEFALKNPTEALKLLSPSLQKCLPRCLEALKMGTVAYIETGNE